MQQPPAPQPGWSIQGSPLPGDGNPPAPRPSGQAQLPKRRRGSLILVGAVALVLGLLIGIAVGRSTGSGQANSAAGAAPATHTGVTPTTDTSGPAQAQRAAATSRVAATRKPGVAPDVTKPASSGLTRSNTSARLTALGSGTFTVGQDLPAGRYVITPKAGENGNLSATTSDDPLAINAILGTADGLGVPTYTATMTKGEVVKISGLSQVKFTPATTKLRTSLSAGDWEVGLDIAAGRYVATPVHGGSGNFIVYDADGLPATDEVLGQANGIGVPNVTVSLTKGERVTISGLTSVTFTAK